MIPPCPRLLPPPARSRLMRLWSLLTVALIVSACSQTVPHGGPRGAAFPETAETHLRPHRPQRGAPESLPFLLVDVTAHSVATLRKQAKEAEEETETPGNTAQNKDTPAPPKLFAADDETADIRLGIGDVLRITIFEAGAGGLFVPDGGTPGGGHFVTIPDQEVDSGGFITVPYASTRKEGSRVRVLGRRPIGVQREIEARLADRAIEPQVVVTIVKRASNRFSVLGDVNKPGRYPVPAGGIRLLEALSTAGGKRADTHEAWVTLNRDGNRTTRRLRRLLETPEPGTYVHPGDVITLRTRPRFFNVLGAVSQQGRLPYDAEALSVTDALARAGGIDDSTADARTVAVLRREAPGTLAALGARPETLARLPDVAGRIPTVYRLNMAEPQGMMLAQAMQVRPKDTVYVSTHPFTDAGKVLRILRDIALIRLLQD